MHPTDIAPARVLVLSWGRRIARLGPWRARWCHWTPWRRPLCELRTARGWRPTELPDAIARRLLP